MFLNREYYRVHADIIIAAQLFFSVLALSMLAKFFPVKEFSTKLGVSPSCWNLLFSYVCLFSALVYGNFALPICAAGKWTNKTSYHMAFAVIMLSSLTVLLIVMMWYWCKQKATKEMGH
jgi:hypothetical protein